MEKGTMLEAQQRLLGEEEEYCSTISNKRRGTIANRLPLTTLNIAFLTLNLLGIFANIIFPTFLRTSSTCESERDLIYSPAREAVAYEKVFSNVTLGEENEFMGEPRPAQSKAWKDAYGNWIHVRVQKEDLDKINRTSIPLADGSGYLASLDVFHQLHCVNQLRQSLHPDYYHNVEETPRIAAQHIDHCIDALRRSAMCQGDISVLTYDWREGIFNPYPNFKMERECRKWDSIIEWTKAHHVDISKDLIRPAWVWPAEENRRV